MTTKELLLQQIEQLEKEGDQTGFLERLSEIRISGPEDLSENFDLYLRGKSRLTPLLVDSAYVIALVNDRDQYHRQALRLARQYRDRPLIIVEGLLLEIGNFFAAHFRRQAVQMIEQFLTSPQVEVVYTSPQLLRAAVSLYKRMFDKEWSLVDCISFQIMRERGITEALTPDHHFTQAGFQVLLTKPR